MESRFTMTWDADELARALKVTVQDVKEYFTDGRRVSFIIERRLMWGKPRFDARSIRALTDGVMGARFKRPYTDLVYQPDARGDGLSAREWFAACVLHPPNEGPARGPGADCGLRRTDASGSPSRRGRCRSRGHRAQGPRTTAARSSFGR
jgi:hypothetical protein